MFMKSQQFYFFKRKSYLSFLNENPSNSYILFIKAYIYIYIYILWGPIDPICSNCIGKGWAQYPVSYVHTALERAGLNTQSKDKRVSEDDQ